MDVFNCTNVQTAGWLNCHQELRVLIDLTGNDGLLLVAAGHAAHGGQAALTAAHIVLGNELIGVFAHLIAADKAALLELRLPVTLQHHVVFQTVVQHQTVLVTVLRDMAHAVLGALADGGMGDVLAIQRDLAVGQLFQTGQAVDKLGLAVALNARQADDLTGVHLEGDILDGILLALIIVHGHVLHVQHHGTGLCRLLFHLQLHITAHHHAGKFFLGGVLDVHGAHVLALAQHGAAVGHGHDLVQLVGNEQDGLAFLLEPAHDLHQFVDLLRGQHCGRLVEDQDLVVAVQHLQDLNTLLHTNRDIADQCIRIHAQAVLFAQGHHLFACLGLLQKAHLVGFHPQNDVVQHAEAFHQLEVLVHHADAQCVGIVGVADGNLLAVFQDLALFRLIQAEQHAHQRTFARAVLAQKGVYLALAQLQGDIIVCLDTGEFLGNVEHLDHIILCQSAHSPFVP